MQGLGIGISDFKMLRIRDNYYSIINYLKNKELVPYWVNTSSNDLIKMTLKNSATVKEKIERLLKDEEIEVPIKR